jgi:hypothetical protein
MDPRGAPQRVGQAHVADQLADFERHLRSAAATSRLPSPERITVSGATRLVAVDHPSCSKLKLLRTSPKPTSNSGPRGLLWIPAWQVGAPRGCAWHSAGCRYAWVLVLDPHLSR